MATNLGVLPPQQIPSAGPPLAMPGPTSHPSSTVTQPQQSDTAAMMTLILQELTLIKQGMQSLGTANTEQTKLISTLKTEFEKHLQEHVSLKSEVSGNSAALASQHTDLCDLQKKVDNYESRIAILEGQSRRQDMLISELRSELTRQTAKTMKANTVFYNITETESETNEQTKSKITNFLRDEMKIPQERVDQIAFLKVHRLGSKQSQKVVKDQEGTDQTDVKPPAPRPIIVKFHDNDKDLVFRHIKMLDRTKFAVTDQFPNEYQEDRLLFKDRMKTDPSLVNVPATDKKLYDNQLIVKGKPYILPERSRETAPEHYNASEVDWERDPPHITVGPTISEKRSVFQGYRAKIRDLEDAQLMVDLIHSDLRSQPATHVAYAYRIQAGSRIIEHMNDDREYGAGRQLLGVLRDKGKVNMMVCVARWYGGQNLGPKRKILYANAAKDVLGLH